MSWGFDKCATNRQFKLMKRRAVLVLPFITTAAFGHSQKHGDIKIGHAWAKPGLVAQDGHCFMPLLNTASAEDALVAARSDICSAIQLRRNARYDDPPETQLLLPNNKPLAMRPHATHLRLMGLSKNLELGDRFNLILDFLNAGEVELEVHVETMPGD
jgi:periplasmic copper chaperone A